MAILFLFLFLFLFPQYVQELGAESRSTLAQLQGETMGDSL
jgi:hypothetical protein